MASSSVEGQNVGAGEGEGSSEENGAEEKDRQLKKRGKFLLVGCTLTCRWVDGELGMKGVGAV